MPITEQGNIEYKMPQLIREKFTFDFCKQMMMELHRIYGVSVEDSDMDHMIHLEGTSGWGVAFTTACRKMNEPDLYKYYYNLPWYDSDIFDSQVTECIVEHKLLMPDFDTTEIARQHCIEEDSLRCCDECGKYYLASDVDLLPEDSGVMSDYICHNCNHTGKVQDYDFDVTRMIKEVLGREEDVFMCPKCGKYHYLWNKGEEFCIHCEITREDNQNANDYYKQELNAQKDFVRQIFPEKNN